MSYRRLTQASRMVWAFVLLALVVSLGSASGVTAQESTPEPLPPTNTPTVEPSQTPTSSPTATPLPTETMTPTVTLDPDLNFFASDFTTGNTTGWTLTPGWVALDEAGNGYLSASTPNETATINGVIWDHFSLVARIGLAPGNSAAIAFRSGIQGYTLSLDATGGLTLYKDQTVLAAGVAIPATDPVTPPPMTWYTISLTASGGTFTASVDGVEQLTYTDPQPLLSGAIAFSSGALNTGEIRLDDVVIQRLPEPVPTEVPVVTEVPVDPEVTPDVTPEPTETVDPQVTPIITPDPVETLDPEATPESTPEPVETLDPEATPEITPEPTEVIDPEATPELDPEATPEITPDTEESGLDDEIVAKLGTVLADTVELTAADQLEEAQTYATRYGAEFDDADRIAVNIWNATGDPMGDFITLVEAAGGEVIYVEPDHLQAYLPVPSLEALATLDMIQAITLPVRAVSSSSSGPADADQNVLTPANIVTVATAQQANALPSDLSRTNAGAGTNRPHSLDILGVNAWTEAGVTGVGINVAIISTGFGNHTSNSDQSCVAQAGTVWFEGGASTSFGAATTGTEMAEVICDIAPNANVYRYRAQNANRTGQALNAAISGFGSFPAADVIVVGLDPSGPNSAFQTALQTAYDQNIPVIVAAGDDGGNLSTTFTYSGAGTVSIVAEQASTITVQRNSGTAVGTTLSLDTAGWSQSQAAGNTVQYTGMGDGNCLNTACLFTLSFNGANTANYTVSVSGGASSEISVTPSAELAITPDAGELTELAEEDLAISVGAVCANPSAHYPIKASSSRGPTGQDNNSNIQPSVVAPAGVLTSISLNPIGPNNCNASGDAFDGTSSAAAHVGGMTALLLSNPDMISRFNTSGAPAGVVVDNIKHYLQTRTIDPNRDGFDNTYGAGVVQLGNPGFNFGLEQNIGTAPGNLPGGVTPVYVSTAYRPVSGEANGSVNAPYTHPAHAISAVETGSANAVVFMPGEYVSSFSAVDNLALYSYEYVDEFVSTNSAIWVNDSYANSGGIAVIDVSGVTIGGFEFEGSSPDYLTTTPSTLLARVSPIFVDGSSDVEIVSNYFANFDRPLTILGTGPDPTDDVRLIDNVFDDFFVESDQSTAALQIFGSGLTTRILIQNNIFQNNSVPRDTASAKQEAILSIQESRVTIISSQFRNNEGEAVIAINQWQGGTADAALPKDGFITDPVEIFGSLFQENDLTGSLVQVLQGVNFAFINNTVVENIINEGGFGSNANYITLGWDGVGTAGAQPWHVSDHEFDIHNNLFYRNDLTGTGGLVRAVANTNVSVTCSSVDGLGNGVGAQGNWIIPDTPSASPPGGNCTLPSPGTTPDANGNLVTSTINGVAYDISDELDRASFETLVFFTAANDPNHPYRLNASNVVPTQLNPGVDPGPYGVTAPDNLVDPGIISGPLDPKAVDVLGIGRFFNQQTEAADSIDIGAYETGDPEDVRFINNAVNGDTIPSDSPGATGYKNYVDGTGEFTFIGLEDQTVSINLNRYLTGGYRPYTFNLTANTTIQNFDPETPCGGTLFSFDQQTGVLTVCPPDDFHNADLSNPGAQIVFEYDAIGVLNTGSALDGQVTVEFLPLNDNVAPRDANGNGEIQFIVTDLNTPVETVLAPNPNFETGFALPDPLDVDYPFAVSDIQVDFTAPGFTRDLFPDGLTDAQINTLVQNSFDSSTGTFSWTPLPGVTGRFEFTYSVTSGDTRIPPGYTSTASGVKTNDARRAQVRIVNSIATPGRYDNTSLNVLFAGDWRPIYLPRTDVHSSTLHRIEQNNRSFSINFLGDAFVVAFRGNDTSGSVQFEIDHNDNGQFLPLDSSVLTNMQCSILSKPTVVSTQLSEPGRFVFGCQGLENIAPNQLRTLRVTTTSSARINLDYIDIRGRTLTPNFYNDNDVALVGQRTGQWQNTERSDAIGGSLMRSDTQGSSISFSIDGNSVDTLAIYHTVDDRHGPMRVAITGLLPFIVDTGDTTGDQERQQPFVVSNLPSGTLNVTITNETQDRIVIEGVELFADRATLTPGLYDSHDPAINYIGPWNNRLRPEPLFDRMWLNLDRRGSAVFNFDGDGIVIYHTMNADRDFFEVCFNGDYNNCERVSAEVGAQWWSNRQVISAPSSGPNTVEIRSANDSAFSIEGIEVLDGQDPLAPGYYEENNSEMRYDGFWRPRLSLLSLGNNIQETEAGSVTFQVDAAEFEGFGFYYRGNTKYGPVRVCRVGGSCVTFNQFRSTRVDSLLEFISASDLSMTSSGIQTIRIDRPSGTDFINIEGLEIVTTLQPDLYQDYSAGLNYAGSWSSVKNTVGPLGDSFSRAETAGAAMTFAVDGDAVDYMAIYHTMNPQHGSFRIQVQGTPEGGGASTEYINEVVDVNSVTERFWSQVKVIPNIGPGTQLVTITSLTNDFVQIEAVELLEESPVLQPGIYNSHEPELQFLGNWQNRERDGAKFGNYWLNLDRRVSLVFEIDGDGVVVFHTMNSDRDRFEICFNGDEATCSQIVAQVGTRWWSNRQVIAAPSDGRHTVEVRSFNQSAFSIEAIEVLDTQAPLAPGYYEEDNSEMRYDGFWRPRLSLLSLGTNIQVAETGGTASFLVDANNFGGLDFFYRGGPEYGPVEICRVGGDCVIVDQERPSRQDSLLRSISPAELSMPVSGIQTITVERPSGSAFINIEALRILPQTPRAFGPGYYEQEDPNFTATGSWFTLTDSRYSNKSVLRTVQTNAEFEFTIGGGTTAEEQVTGFAVFTTLRTTPTTFDICYTRQSTGTEICQVGLSTQSPISTFVTPYGNSVYGLHPLEDDDITNETYSVRVIHRGSGPFDIDAISVYGNYGAALVENTTSNPFYNDDEDEIVYPFAWSRLFDDQYQGGTGAFTEIVGVPQQVTVEGSSVTIYIPIAEDLSNQVRFCVISDGAADQRCATFSQNSAIGTETTSVPITFFGLGTGTKNIIIENLDPTRRAVIEAITVH